MGIVYHDAKLAHIVEIYYRLTVNLRLALPRNYAAAPKKYRESFAVSELGRIRALLPLKEMADELASHFPKKHSRGNTPMFPPDGEIALMFLKPYTGLSDDGLIEMLNGSIHMQMFCGVLIDPSRPIKDGKIVSAIRNRLAPRLDIVRQQSVLYKKWDSMLKDKDLCMSDATCYESHLRYPTDIKLMWECCEWLHKLLQKTCREQGERLPRSKYNEVAKARLAYAKQRKPKKSATRRMQRRLLKLLGKLIGQWNCLCRLYAPVIHLSAEQDKRIMAIKEVHRQQTDHFNKKEVKHRIVSIDRPYIRPIVRGKENKRVEFGAKVNNIQVDGISFIEHHSFEAFNEGTRLKQCVEYQESLTGVKVTRIGMDTIYANNENRKYCTERGITTNFVRKGPKPKDEQADISTARRIIGNLRATVMEGSFGNQKQHFGVGRIAARNRHSETLLLFFGIHMANTATLAARQLAVELRQKEKKRA